MRQAWESREESQQPRKRRRLRWLRWVLIVLIVIIVCVLGAAWYLYRQFQPPVGHGTQRITIAKGESVSRIASDLQAHGAVRNGFLFRLYVRQEHAGPLLRAGQYDVLIGSTIPQIVNQFVEGHTIDTSVQVTFPEGFTIEQMAQRLQDEHICSKQDFLYAVQHDTFREPFVQQLSGRNGVRFRLEGFLFPDTYDFTHGESAHKVIDDMLQAFAAQVQPLQPQMQKKQMTLNQLVTVASMVESEAKVEKERPVIASVIDNRLNHQPPMKLQIDATVEYALGHHTNIVTYHDLNVDSPYNTYRYLGLPPGPICNPGVESLQAALNPKHTPYLYYVAKNNGTGEHYFAKTLAEQNHNEQLSNQNVKKHS